MRVRAAGASDRDFVLREVERLADFELPSWRRPEEIYEVERRMLARLFDDQLAQADGLLVAEADGERLGFAWLERPRDFFTGVEHAHVGIVLTSKAAEGKGIGRLLMEAAEQWARERGLPFVTLNVFGVNSRARALYERLGYRVETIKYRREL